MVSASAFFKGIISRKHFTSTPSSSQRQNTDNSSTVLTSVHSSATKLYMDSVLRRFRIDSSTHVPNDSINSTTATLDVYTSFLGAVSRNCFKYWLPHRTTTSTSFSNLPVECATRCLVRKCVRGIRHFNAALFWALFCASSF